MSCARVPLPLLLICLLLPCLSCRPRKTRFADAPPDTAALPAHIKTITNPDSDGTAAVVANQAAVSRLTASLPPHLRQLLDEYTPGWRLPALPAATLEKAKAYAQGPYYLSADYDANGLPDYAVQIERQDSTQVLVLLQRPEGYLLRRLRAAPFSRSRGSGLSLFQLFPVGRKKAPATGQTAAEAERAVIGLHDAGQEYRYAWQGERLEQLPP